LLLNTGLTGHPSSIGRRRAEDVALADVLAGDFLTAVLRAFPQPSFQSLQTVRCSCMPSWILTALCACPRAQELTEAVRVVLVKLAPAARVAAATLAALPGVDAAAADVRNTCLAVYAGICTDAWRRCVCICGVCCGAAQELISSVLSTADARKQRKFIRSMLQAVPGVRFAMQPHPCVAYD
jgi:hypothetical protein